jgi:crotonobetainyl-CoA:carnitine CoA-transferase CaiB-like acyl-CoA transferase
MLGLQNEREWHVFCNKVLGQPALQDDARFASNPARVAHKAELTGIIEDAFADKTAEQVLDVLENAGIANARMNDMAGLWAHPQLAARDRWRQVATSAGNVPALLPPGWPADVEARMGPVPALGEHNRAILTELGLSAVEIEALG